MKLLATSDLHQHDSKWDSLVEVCEQTQFDVVAVAGDLFPKVGFRKQIRYLDMIKRKARRIKKTGAELVLILGNDDNQNFHEKFQEQNGKLWHYVCERVCEIQGYEFIGMPWVPDYPFGYKYWCRGECKDNLRIDPIQFMTPPIILDKYSQYVRLHDYQEYLSQLPTIQDSLLACSHLVKNMQRSIWLIHAPPSGLGLDVCYDGRRVGSDSIHKFIVDKQPLLTLHGHIHESPEVTLQWSGHIGNTLCIQPGQIGMALHYVTINIEKEGIKHEHSFY